jgi:hypothetical protein
VLATILGRTCLPSKGACRQPVERYLVECRDSAKLAADEVQLVLDDERRGGGPAFLMISTPSWNLAPCAIELRHAHHRHNDLPACRRSALNCA